MDYYETLGVSKTASAKEIKSAYRKKALEWHPDRNKAKEAESRFKEINQAYEVLSDQEKRKVYDQFGHEAFTKGGYGRRAPGGGGDARSYQQGPFTYTYTTSGGSPFEGVDFGGFSDPFDIFEQFFGGGAGRASRQKPLYQIELSFDEAVHGIKKKVNVDGKQKEIKIPAGVDDGNRIRFSDFDLVISVTPDKQWERHGQDVYTQVELPLTTAILGGTINVPTIDGKKVTLKIREGTQPGARMRLAGKGVPYLNTLKRGDLYIVFRVTMPEHLTRRQKELIHEFEKEGR